MAVIKTHHNAYATHYHIVFRGQPTPGVTGTAVQVARVTFQALTAVNPTNIPFYFTGVGASGDSGVILNDSLGTDILTSVANASFIINATSSQDITAPSTSTQKKEITIKKGYR